MAIAASYMICWVGGFRGLFTLGKRIIISLSLCGAGGEGEGPALVLAK